MAFLTATHPGHGEGTQLTSDSSDTHDPPSFTLNTPMPNGIHTYSWLPEVFLLCTSQFVHVTPCLVIGSNYALN